MSPLDLFFEVLRAAALSVGGAGSLPLLRESLVVPGHVTEAQVLESLAIGRLSTGPTGLYVVSLGYFALGWVGAAVALAAAVLPPLSLVAVATVGRRWLLTPWAAGIIRGIALSTSGLLVATSVQLVDPGAVQVALALAGLAAMLHGRVHPALMILGGALAGAALEAL
ncbi:MAG: chromate transporter [Chloroflexi bacterium]|nr:chromate transporter [Chloroflexota bacterium]